MSNVVENIGRLLLPGITWHGNRQSDKVYLTFDDGPTPRVTEQVLQLLEAYNAKATFFCLGKQVEQYPDVVKSILAAGHVVGNHGFAHLSGWGTEVNAYLKDVEDGRKALEAIGVGVKYFRPAYGKVNMLSLPVLKDRYEKVVLWDVMPHDYDPRLSADKVLVNALKDIDKGSIIVLHDSEKAAPNMLAVLPKLLQQLSSKKYKFATLDELEEL